MKKGNDECSKHVWRFFRSGGFAQVRLETAADIVNLRQLDHKLWSALSCPVHGIGLALDERALELIDTDKDDRIRPPEILAAVDFACGLLKDAGSLLGRSSSLRLEEIDTSTPEGERVAASARRVLAEIGKSEAVEISVEDVDEFQAKLAAATFNGDGIFPPTSTSEADLALLMEEILKTIGGQTDPGGGQGVDRGEVEAFFKAAEDYSEWLTVAEADPSGILPLGENTSAMAALFTKLEPKVEDYFTRCRMARFDDRAGTLLNRSEEDIKTLAGLSLSPRSEELGSFPLARVVADRPLPLDGGVNPAWAADVDAFREGALKPLVGSSDCLDEGCWERVRTAFAPHLTWAASKKGGEVEVLGIERVRELLAGDFRQRLMDLFDRDEVVRVEVEALGSLKRLLFYHRHLFTLLNNLVTFSDFYSRRAKAIFQVGTLYIDGRSLDLCVRVDDAAAHSGLAANSNTYLVYCECARRGSGEKMTIAAALTDGDATRLMVGRNGVFYDRQGKDWDATVVRLLEHPISIRQGFKAPYLKLGKMVGEQMRKFAAAKDKEVAAASVKAMEGTSKVAETAKPPPQPFDVGKFAGIFAAIGLAVGALATAVATILTGFLGLTWWKMPLALAGLALIISGPSVLLAALNLRNRSLAPILDANGWAVNSNAKLNIVFGKSLTVLAKLPEDSDSSLVDPFAEKSRTWIYYVALGVTAAAGGLLWKFRLVEKVLTALAGS